MSECRKHKGKSQSYKLSLEVLARVVTEEIKGTQTRKKEKKLEQFPFVDGIHVCMYKILWRQ